MDEETIIVPTPAVEIPPLADRDDVEALSEQLDVIEAIADDRFDELVEYEREIVECLNRLEQSSTATENPSYQALVTEVATLRADLAELKGMALIIQQSITSLQATALQPNESEPALEVENPAEQSEAESTSEPAPAASPASTTERQKPRRRVL